MDWQQWTALVVILVSCQVLIDMLLVDFLDLWLDDDLGPDNRLLHEVLVERGVS